MAQFSIAEERPRAPAHGISLNEAFWVWLRVALLSFWWASRTDRRDAPYPG